MDNEQSILHIVFKVLYQMPEINLISLQQMQRLSDIILTLLYLAHKFSDTHACGAMVSVIGDGAKPGNRQRLWKKNPFNDLNGQSHICWVPNAITLNCTCAIQVKRHHIHV
jgi:hypothetical protein